MIVACMDSLATRPRISLFGDEFECCDDFDRDSAPTLLVHELLRIQVVCPLLVSITSWVLCATRRSRKIHTTTSQMDWKFESLHVRVFQTVFAC